jgi:hypothetical protein
MAKKDIDLTAYCGLYCGDCVRFNSKAAKAAKEFLEAMQNEDWQSYGVISPDEGFSFYTGSREYLQAIANRQCSVGCRKGGGCPAFACNIVACCKTKGYEGCWQCDSFETCKEFEFLEHYHGCSNVENLRLIKKYGLEKWPKHRKACYVWQQEKDESSGIQDNP